MLQTLVTASERIGKNPNPAETQNRCPETFQATFKRNDSNGNMSLEIEVIDIDDDVVPLSPPPLKKAKLTSVTTEVVPAAVAVTQPSNGNATANGGSGGHQEQRPSVTVSIENVVVAVKNYGNVTKNDLEKVLT